MKRKFIVYKDTFSQVGMIHKLNQVYQVSFLLVQRSTHVYRCDFDSSGSTLGSSNLTGAFRGAPGWLCVLGKPFESLSSLVDISSFDLYS